MKTNKNKTASKKVVSRKKPLKSAVKPKVKLAIKERPQTKLVAKRRTPVASKKKTSKVAAVRTKPALKKKSTKSVAKTIKRPARACKHETYVGVDKKINTVFAIFFIALLSSIIGTLVFLSSRREQQLANDLVAQAAVAQEITAKSLLSARERKQEAAIEKSKNDDAATEQSNCSTHKFEGQANIHGWYASEQEAGSEGVFVGVAADDLKELPLIEGVPADSTDDFVIKLVDASPTLIEKFKQATKEKPQEFVVKGYVYICDGIHLSSVKPGSQVF